MTSFINRTADLAAQLPDSHVVATVTVTERDLMEETLRLPDEIAEQFAHVLSSSIHLQITPQPLGGEREVSRSYLSGNVLTCVDWPLTVAPDATVDLVVLRTGGWTRHLGVRVR